MNKRFIEDKMGFKQNVSTFILRILLLIVSAILIVCDNPTVNTPKESIKRITAFSIDDQAATAKITESAHLITLVVPYGTSISSVSPSVAYIGASIHPSIGSVIDFTDPVIYTVTAEDGSKQNYTAIVKVALNSSKMITSCNLTYPDINGNINDATKSITITVPSGQPVTSLTPDIVHTGKSISPESGLQQDFTNPVTYTITAEDGTKQDYEVAVQKKTMADTLNFLILGNSIVHHAPLSSIGWDGDWGMAASCKENDCVHVLTAKISNCFVTTTVNYKEQNIAAWEQDFFTDLKNYPLIAGYIPDVLIIRLGENVNEDYAKANNYYLELFKVIHYHPIGFQKS